MKVESPLDCQDYLIVITVMLSFAFQYMALMLRCKLNNSYTSISLGIKCIYVAWPYLVFMYICRFCAASSFIIGIRFPFVPC